MKCLFCSHTLARIHKAKCDSERQAGLEARDFLMEQLSSEKDDVHGIDLELCKWDKYGGRILNKFWPVCDHPKFDTRVISYSAKTAPD